MDWLGHLWFELALFAGCGFLLFGIDDLAVDLVWLVTRKPDQILREGADTNPFHIAVFIPAWDEGEVIAAMIRSTLLRWQGDRNVTLYIGVYPNDAATRDAALALQSEQVRVVVNHAPGPTTKADCLNTLWRRYVQEKGAFDPTRHAIVLHDAEDVVHRLELALYRLHLAEIAMIQIPVMPLADPRSPWIAGHYIDEFSEAHGKELVVRTTIHASLPSAGVGCAIRADCLLRLAQMRGGNPFNEASLTEDYELGLRLSELGVATRFVRMRCPDTGELIAVRAHFPDRLGDAVRQKTRWVTGIALVGWDRTGWHGGPAEWWMRWRDRRTILSSIILVCGYLAVMLALMLIEAGRMHLHADSLSWLFALTFLLLMWRLMLRFWLVHLHYGWREALHAIPRALVSSVIAVMAARRALIQYVSILRTGQVTWDKTRHIFPDVAEP